MPKIKVDTHSTLTHDETFQRIKIFLESDADLRKFDAELSCTFDEKSKKGKATGKQFTACFVVTTAESPAKGVCKVEVELEIPFLLTPLKGKIQETLEKKLRRALG